jgi:hypothetical protein
MPTTDTTSSSSSSDSDASNNNNNNNTHNDDSSSPSCIKCVKVLRDLISELQENKTVKGGGEKGVESPPLTLLRAIIAGGANNHHAPLKIEHIDDGVKMHLPVETTLPTLLRRWSSLYRQQQEEADNGITTPTLNGGSSSIPLLATSAVESEDTSISTSTIATTNDPLTIELKCRKCASSGPEGGARAFLMGPQPLSVVVCHNRIQSDQTEVEEILTHELVHLYDVQTLQLDLQQCENLAYSEVRAAKAAECRDSWKQLQSYCVKQKAICATNNLFPLEGRKCIHTVFDKAFADNRPFEK